MKKNESVIPQQSACEALSLQESHRLAHELLGHLTELELENDELKRKLAALEAGNSETPSAPKPRPTDSDRHAVGEKAPLPHKRLLRCIIDSVGDLIYIKSRDGVYLACNAASEKLIGLTESEQVGKTDFYFFDRDFADTIRTNDGQILAAGLEQRFEEWVTYPDGKKVLLDTVKAPFYGPDGNVAGIVGISRDITEQHLLKEELIRNQKLESLGVLAGGIAHDFNNILTGIIGSISLARMFLEESHRATKNLLRAEQACQRATGLAQQLLTFAKGSQPIKKTFSAGHLIDSSVSLVLSGSNVLPVVETAEDIRDLEVDEGLISQAFSNIIINAAQAMPGGGTLTISAANCTLGAANLMFMAAGEYVRFTFTDTGCGISSEDQKKIFDPYFTTKSSGHGLGLATAHSIVSKHGGHISVRSMPANGTTFEILLPASIHKAVNGSAERAAVLPRENSGTSLLVMDDEELIRDLSSDMLAALGFHVRTCVNGEEAITHYKAAKEAGAPFSAVITDLTIPGGMGGKEAAQQILKIDPDARLIVSSGYSTDPIIANYADYGFCARILKPYTIDQIAKTLDEVLIQTLSAA